MTPLEWGMLVALSVLWGGSFFFTGIAVQELPPLTIVFLRVALAAVILLAVLNATGMRMPKDKSVWLAFLAYVLYFRLLASAGATNLLLATFLIPVSAIVLGSLVLGETLQAKQFAGMVCIGLGLAAIDGRVMAKLRSRPRSAAPANDVAASLNDPAVYQGRDI